MRRSHHDYPRDEQIKGLKAIIDFLEANPEFDIPEGMGECLVRTLVHENRGELKDKQSKAAWFRKQVEILRPDHIYSGTDFDAIRDFGGGTQIVVHISVEAVCDKIVETKTINQPLTVEEATWQAPEALIEMGFVPDQEELRERDASYRRFTSRAA
jgi:hypothetical protein